MDDGEKQVWVCLCNQTFNNPDDRMAHICKAQIVADAVSRITKILNESINLAVDVEFTRKRSNTF